MCRAVVFRHVGAEQSVVLTELLDRASHTASTRRHDLRPSSDELRAEQLERVNPFGPR